MCPGLWLDELGCFLWSLETWLETSFVFYHKPLINFNLIWNIASSAADSRTGFNRLRLVTFVRAQSAF